MRQKVIFPSAINYIRIINSNILDNLRAGRTSFVNMPNIYSRAYSLINETGEVTLIENVIAPDESTSSSSGVRIISRNS